MMIITSIALIVSCAGLASAKGPSALQNVQLNAALDDAAQMGASVDGLNQAYDLAGQHRGTLQTPKVPRNQLLDDQAGQQKDQKAATPATPAAAQNQTIPAIPDTLEPDTSEPIDDPDCTKDNKKNDRKDPCQAGDRGKAHGLMLHSKKWEIQQGKIAAMQVQQSSKMIGDPAIQEWVNRFCSNLWEHTDAPRLHYPPVNCQIIDSDEVNAFALPSGNIFIYAGLLEKAGDEAEVAGVLGHEIAHVAMRHSNKMASKGEIAMVGLYGSMILCPVCTYPVYYGSQFMLPAMFFKFSRTMEAEADRYGAQYARNAGYDPQGMVDFFGRIDKATWKKDKRGQLSATSGLFSTHPLTPERARAIEKEIAGFPAPQGGYLIADSVGDGVKVSDAQGPEQSGATPDSGQVPDSTKMGFMGVKKRLVDLRAMEAEKIAATKAAEDDVTQSKHKTLEKKKKDPSDDPNSPGPTQDKPVINAHPQPDNQ